MTKIIIVKLKCGWRDLNPHALWAADFESAASAIPPHPHSNKKFIIITCYCQ